VPVPTLTTAEIVQVLLHTSMPTLLVEGPTDADVFRLVESRAGLLGGTVLSCGGKKPLLEVYSRRNEFPHLKCVFLSDADLWHFGEVPVEYSDVLVTSGVSIENDILDGDAVERLLSTSERAEFSVLIDCLVDWFAFEVTEWSQGRDPLLDIHVNVLVPSGTGVLCDKWCVSRGYVAPPSTLVGSIRANYRVKLRGKQLLQALLRFLSASSRSSKYSRYNLLEIAATSPEHSRFERLCSQIRAGLL